MNQIEQRVEHARGLIECRLALKKIGYKLLYVNDNTHSCKILTDEKVVVSIRPFGKTLDPSKPIMIEVRYGLVKRTFQYHANQTEFDVEPVIQYVMSHTEQVRSKKRVATIDEQLQKKYNDMMNQALLRHGELKPYLITVQINSGGINLSFTVNTESQLDDLLSCLERKAGK